MNPLTLSHFWQRRIYEVVLLLSLSIVALYAVPITIDQPATGLFAVDFYAALGAALTAGLALCFLFLKNKQSSYVPSYVVFLLLVATVGYLIATTGDHTSPFATLWPLLAIGSGIFAIWGVLPILGVTGVFIAAMYLRGDLSIETGAFAALLSIVPALFSLLIWRNEGVIDESTRHVKSLTTQLSEVANRSEIIINAIGDGVVAIDGAGVIQLINPAGQESLGWGKQDALKLQYRSVLNMMDANNHELEKHQDPIHTVLNSNQTVRSKTLTIQTKTGKSIMSSMVVSPIGESGAGVIAVFRDITKEKAEEREQAEFISTASHEMRTPVASIEGYLGLAMNPNTATVDDKARDFINKAHEAAQHLGRLFQDLLDVSKSEDGRMTNNPRVTDVTALAGSVVDGLRAKATEKGLQLNFTPTAQRALKTFTPLYFVNQDTDHIREILDNLIENAIKYTPQGEVTVDVQSVTEDKVTVSVKDSGLGIPPEDVPHLFQKFYRVNNVDRQSIGGTGLGLYLSRRLAEGMQGRLWVESIYEKGSTFFLELPRITNEEAEQLKNSQIDKAETREVPTFTAAPVEAVVLPGSSTPVPQPAPLQAVAQTVLTAAPELAAPPAPQSVITPVAQATEPTQTPVQPIEFTPAQPAPNVPRGQNLTREQIAERVRQLEAMARATRPAARPDAGNQTQQP